MVSDVSINMNSRVYKRVSNFHELAFTHFCLLFETDRKVSHNLGSYFLPNLESDFSTYLLLYLSTGVRVRQ